MNIFGRGTRFSRPRSGERILVSLLSLALLFPTWPQSVSAFQDAQAPGQAAQAQSYMQQTPEKLQQLVAPIALYPDSLVAQMMAASTFPEQIVEADRWVQAHPDLKDDALGQAVDQQSWDPSVKALIAFPSVLGNMDKNLSWTSSLGDAYYNQEQDVMDAVQVMRRQAQESGNLKSTPHQSVTTQGSTIIVEPANPVVVYVPAYDPWVVYGALSWRGRDGTRTPEFGMTVRTSGSAPASESVGSEVMDGAGIIGDAIGMNEACFTTTTGTALGVTHSITGTTSTGIEANAVGMTATVVERMTTPTKGAGLPTGTSAGAAKFITIPVQQPGLSVEIPGLLEDTLNPVGRAAFARGPSAAMTVADKKKAFRHAEAPASAAAERFTGAVAVIGNRSSLRSW